MNAPAAWDTTTGDTTQIIGIIDTGVDWTHPDLSPNIWTNWDEIPGNGIDDDGNGKIDDRQGWDFVNNDNNPTDDNSHGTHVAGIAAAKGNNGVGMAGVAWNSKIMPIKVMQSSGYGSSTDVANGVNYARLNGATILNLSLGSYGESLTLKTALENAYSNSVIVAAAGNDRREIEGKYGSPFYPACYSWVIGVEATKQVPASCCSGCTPTYRACFSNYDPSGPIVSGNSNGYNYEIQAPGVDMLSTFPNGRYHLLNGTSMATPVVAGAVALIKSHNPTLTTEQLFARFIQSSSSGILNIFSALNYTLVPDLYYVSNAVVDTLSGDDNDGVPDAGETIQLYLKVKNAGGWADSVWSKLSFAPYEDTTVAAIMDSTSYLGNISAYASQTGTLDPFKIHIKPWVANNRDIMFQCEIGAKNTTQKIQGLIKLTIQKGFEVGGLINTDQIWTPDKEYMVTSNLRVAEGVCLIVKPGTNIRLFQDKSIEIRGKLLMVGTMDSTINISGSNYHINESTIKISNQVDTCKIFYTRFTSIPTPIFKNYGSQGYLVCNNNYFSYCGMDGLISYPSTFGLNENAQFEKNVFTSSFLSPCYLNNLVNGSFNNRFNYNVFQSNVISTGYSVGALVITYNINTLPPLMFPTGNSFFGNHYSNSHSLECNLTIDGNASYAQFDNNYWGTTDSLRIKSGIIDFETYPSWPVCVFYPFLHQPSPLAHGHIWKIEIDSVEVNKFDHPYNSFNGLGIVGPGLHRFDVYFNRAMDISVTPFLTFGVREPYTQKVVTDSASWSADSTIWTAFYNIGIETGDGIQRVRVEGARDNEHFEIPTEDSRFEFVIQAAGSASIEFMATPGIGKVYLEWNRAGTEDALGYNMYRYYNITDSIFSAPVRINSSLITDTLFTDFGVIPDTTYHYYYKVVGTDLQESDSSKIIVAIPIAAANGDANGDMSVSVLDITAVIAYMLNQNPQPFLFDAADVNSDNTINVLDVIGIVDIILGKKKLVSSTITSNPDPAHIYLDLDRIRFRSDGQVAALQFELTGQNPDQVRLIMKQPGFEFATGIVNGKLMGILYNLDNRTLPAGMIDLIGIEGLSKPLAWGDVTAGDPLGQYVLVLKDVQEPLPANENHLKAFPNPFKETVAITYRLTEPAMITLEIYDSKGKFIRILENRENITGIHKAVWSGKGVPTGIYFCRLSGKTKSGKELKSELKIVLTK